MALRAGPAGTAESEVVLYTCARRSGSSVDMSTCTGASVEVWRPDGSSSTWSFTVLSATTSAVVLRYVRTDDDCPYAGSYRCRPTLAFPDGTRRGEPFMISVEAW